MVIFEESFGFHDSFELYFFFRSFLFLSLGERDRNEPKNKKESQPFLCRRKGAKRRLQGVRSINGRTSYSGYKCRLLHSRLQTTIRYVSNSKYILQRVVSGVTASTFQGSHTVAKYGSATLHRTHNGDFEILHLFLRFEFYSAPEN